MTSSGQGKQAGNALLLLGAAGEQMSTGILEGRAKPSSIPDLPLNSPAWFEQTLFADISSSLPPCSGSRPARPQALPSLGKSESLLGAGVVWSGIITPLLVSLS